MPDHVLQNYITPYVMDNCGDADLVLLAGSQARSMNGEAQPAGAARKNSDYDFVIVYDKLPQRYPAALFASAWIDVPEQDNPVSIDMKIMDYDYLNFYAQHTREVRRFPFLFSMINDGAPILDRANALPALKSDTKSLLQAGPAGLGSAQIQEAAEKVNHYSSFLRNATDIVDCEILALEGINLLAQNYLRSSLVWDSPIGRNLGAIAAHSPGYETKITVGYNNVGQGNMNGYDGIITDIHNNLLCRGQENAPNSVLLRQDIAAFVSHDEKELSDRNSTRIMTGQYIARLESPEGLDTGRKIELESNLWSTMKRGLCDRTGVPFGYGRGAADQADQKFGKPVLAQLFSAIKEGDMCKAGQAANDITADQGGLKFDYLERVYVEDLARRRAATTPTPKARLG